MANRNLNSCVVSADADMAAFRCKDYRVKSGDRQKLMGSALSEFTRRLLMHVLPDGFQRIWHYGLLACSVRKTNLAKCRALLCDRPPEQACAKEVEPAEPEVTPLTLREPCPCCGEPIRIIETFRRGQKPMLCAAMRAGRMTYKPFVKVSKPNPGWLHQAESARLRCVDRSRAWLANTVPPNKADVPGPKAGILLCPAL